MRRILSGAKKLDLTDTVAVHRIMEVYMLKSGITLESIKQMSETEVTEYMAVLQVMQEIEADKMAAMGVK